MALFIFNISMKHDLGFLLNRNTFLLQFLVQKTEKCFLLHSRLGYERSKVKAAAAMELAWLNFSYVGAEIERGSSLIKTKKLRFRVTWP